MRIAFAMGLLAFAVAPTASGAMAAETKNKLIITIDLSEFTPSATLEIDLTSGDYVVIPPTKRWPEGFQMRPRQAGRLKPNVLANVRLLSDRAFESGVNDPKCIVKLPGGPPPPPSMAVGPDHLILVKNDVTIMSENIYCLTHEAKAVYDYVTKLSYDPKIVSY